VVSAQDTPDWNKANLKDSVITLLLKYQDLHNKLNIHADPIVERDFTRLFSNPKVQVISYLEGNSKLVKISIEEYIIRLAELYPDGFTAGIDPFRISIDLPRYDRNNRYIIRARVNIKYSGISKGVVFTTSQRILLQIAFLLTNNTPGNFAVYGIDLPAKGQDFMALSLNPALTGFRNSTISKDERLSLRMGNSFHAGISYSHYFGNHLGIGTGIRYSRYSGSVGLDKIDPLGSFNPNFNEVTVQNDLWFAEIPLFISWRSNPGRRWGAQADIGLSGGIRMYENMATSATNANTGITMLNVISDADWISQMNRVDIGFIGTLSATCRINNYARILIGAGYRQGLSGLDNNTRADYVYSKYQGQYNPLWGAPGKTVNQALLLNIGVLVLLNKEVN
jgi:hypothetical protein